MTRAGLPPALLAALTLGCGEALLADAPLAGPFEVRGGALVDAHGGRLLLRGVNLSQTAKEAPFHPRELEGEGLSALGARGPLAIRYLSSWAAIEPRPGEYDESYLAELARRAHLLAGAGHLLVLDLHQDLFGVGFRGANGAPRFACDEAHYAAFTPAESWFLDYQDPAVQACFDALFADEAKLRAMASALARAATAVKTAAPDALVGVDLINEPHPGSLSPGEFDARLQRYYDLAAEALSELAVPLFFEPNVLHNLDEPTRLARAPSSRAVFAPHLYPADAELAAYGDQGALAQLIARDAAEAQALGVPFAIGELGPKLEDPARLRFVDDVVGLLDQRFAGGFFWDWSATSDRGLLRPEAEAVRAAALRPHARRVAGVPIRHAYDPSSATLTLEWRDEGVEGATELVRAGASGWELVELSDGEIGEAGALLRVRTAARSEAHRLVIRFRW